MNELSICLFIDETVKSDLKKIVGDCTFNPESPKDIAQKIFFTAHMKSKDSNEESKDRAKKLAEQIGRYIVFNLTY